jgi:hypothetical protein
MSTPMMAITTNSSISVNPDRRRAEAIMTASYDKNCTF